MGRAERSPFIADAADRDDRRSKALVNAAKFTASHPGIAILKQQLNRGAQLFEITALFFHASLRRQDRADTHLGGLFGRLCKSGQCLNFFDDTKKKCVGCTGFVYPAIVAGSPRASVASATVI
jgi:hypothetical protein